MSKLPPDDLFAHLELPVHHCALVSSSGALAGSGLGAKIDSHHLVMRLNNAPTKGFEKDVGALRFQPQLHLPPPFPRCFSMLTRSAQATLCTAVHHDR